MGKQIVKKDGEIVQIKDDSIEDIVALQPAEPVVLTQEQLAAARPEGYAARQAAKVELPPIDEHAAERAAEQLDEFSLTPGADSLLQRAIDNTIGNKGVGLDDPQARADAEARSALLEAADGDLSVAVSVIVECSEGREVAGTVYSLLYNVLKSATFIANMDYRRALDPKGDFDFSIYAPQGFTTKGEDGKDRLDPDFVEYFVDRREDDSPLDGLTGHESRLEYQLNLMKELYGNTFEQMEDAIVRSLQDLQLFFQLTVESMGWDPNRPMPYGYIVVDATKAMFEPITDVEAALDTQEIKRQAAKSRKRDKSNAMKTVMAAKAAERVAALLSKR